MGSTAQPSSACNTASDSFGQDVVVLLIENSSALALNDLWPNLRDVYLPQLIQDFRDASQPPFPFKIILLESCARQPPIVCDDLSDGLRNLMFDYDPSNRISIDNVYKALDIFFELRSEGFRHFHLVLIAASTPKDLSNQVPEMPQAWSQLVPQLSKARIHLHLFLCASLGSENSSLFALYKQTLHRQGASRRLAPFPVDQRFCAYLSSYLDYNADPLSSVNGPPTISHIKKSGRASPKSTPTLSGESISPDTPTSIIEHIQQNQGLMRKRPGNLKTRRKEPFIRDEGVRAVYNTTGTPLLRINSSRTIPVRLPIPPVLSASYKRPERHVAVPAASHDSLQHRKSLSQEAAIGDQSAVLGPPHVVEGSNMSMSVSGVPTSPVYSPLTSVGSGSGWSPTSSSVSSHGSPSEMMSCAVSEYMPMSPPIAPASVAEPSNQSVRYIGHQQPPIGHSTGPIDSSPSTTVMVAGTSMEQTDVAAAAMEGCQTTLPSTRAHILALYQPHLGPPIPGHTGSHSKAQKQLSQLPPPPAIPPLVLQTHVPASPSSNSAASSYAQSPHSVLPTGQGDAQVNVSSDMRGDLASLNPSSYSASVQTIPHTGPVEPLLYSTATNGYLPAPASASSLPSSAPTHLNGGAHGAEAMAISLPPTRQTDFDALHESDSSSEGLKKVLAAGERKMNWVPDAVKLEREVDPEIPSNYHIDQQSIPFHYAGGRCYPAAYPGSRDYYGTTLSRHALSSSTYPVFQNHAPSSLVGWAG